MITNTVQRQKAQFIYDTYFNWNQDSTPFDFLDTVDFYIGGGIKTDKLVKKLDRIGDRLFVEMEKYDKRRLEEINKL